MDVEQASAQIDQLIERRSSERNAANALAELWRASERRHREKLRRQHRAAWFCHWSALAESLRASAAEFEAKAARLLEEDERRETA